MRIYIRHIFMGLNKTLIFVKQNCLKKIVCGVCRTYKCTSVEPYNMHCNKVKMFELNEVHHKRIKLKNMKPCLNKYETMFEFCKATYLV
jgi:hypothetical protein